ncbi:aldehyde dehydrogenase family protein [Methyloprofundus sp.]|uniref:aldehyde dehydrogenase family protein n=1 Tax=Methyloprofundus sp. TaxID=2020875 RepID=UPI003D133C46
MITHEPLHYSVQVQGAAGKGILEVTSPFNGELVASIETIDEKGAEQALDNAFQAYNNRNGWLPADKRIAILERTVVLMRERFDRLVQIAVREGGKPLIDTRIEVERAIDGLSLCIDCIRSEHGREIPMQLNSSSSQRFAITHKEPIGVVVAVSAFNHPLNLIIHQVGPAVASGCPVIIKPAKDTAASCFEFVKLLREAGLPDGWCQAVAVTDLGVAEKLVTDSRVAFFSFIGSAKIGWTLRSKLAAGTRCALEHGGAAPVIMAEDADLEKTLPLVVKGGFYHAGQVCVSVQRVFVHKTLINNVAERMAELVGQLQTGDPLLARTDVGPLIRHHEVTRIGDWVDAATISGAQVLTGGKQLADSFYAPTVLLNPSVTSEVSHREIFGPVVCLYTYDKIDEAIQQANALPFAFQAAVMSQNIDTIMYVYKHLAASAVMVNDHSAFRVDWMPFSGLRQSGYGVGGIPYTFRDMHIEKMLVIRSLAL